MVTNETKNGRKFIKMYDPETGEYLGPLVNMTHEEAHGKKPEGTLEIKIDKEAWDKLKYEYDVDGDHVELSGPPVFDPNTAMRYWSLSSIRRTSFSPLTCLGLRRTSTISSLTTTLHAR